MNWSTEFATLRPGVEALVLFSVDDRETMVLARRKGAGWESTWDGGQIPSEWRALMFCLPTPPDAAILEGDY